MNVADDDRVHHGASDRRAAGRLTTDQRIEVVDLGSGLES